MPGKGDGIARSAALGRGVFQRSGIGGSPGIARSGSLDLYAGVEVARTGPSPCFRSPTFTGQFRIAGVTKDSAGTPLGGVQLRLFRATPRLVYISDTFSRVLGSGVGTADGGSDPNRTWDPPGEGSDTDVMVDGSALVLTHDANFWRSHIGSPTPDNVDYYVEVSDFGVADAVFKDIELYLRWVSTSNHYRFDFINDQGTSDFTYQLAISKRTTAGGGSAIILSRILSLTRTDAFHLRAQAETLGTGAVALRLKKWEAGTAEPAEWTISYTDASDVILQGRYGLRLANKGTSDMRIDNLLISKIPQSVSVDVQEAQTISDPTTGAYEFVLGQNTYQFYIVAYKPGFPDLAGTTVDTLRAA